jgi:UDP-N-acetylmuramoyl-L-alanyl-D-glutamate--2,6-diaminopimelate ligase
VSAPPLTLADVAGLLDAAVPTGAGVVVTGVTHDSSSVRAGDLFAALPGARHHGATFIPQARAAGAVAVLTDDAGRAAADENGLPVLVVPDPRAVLGLVAAEVHGRPADDLVVLGVTGTNGKTTTAHLLFAALSAADPSAGLVGTVQTRVGDDVVSSVRTTPEATDLQQLFATMRERGARSVAMEASSIAVSMGRVDGFVFDVVGFTNLSQDHLDFHGDMASYLAAKAALFTPEHARRGVVVIDDEAGRDVARRATVPVTTLSVDDGAVGSRAADWTAVDVEARPDGSTGFTVVAPDGSRTPAEVRLPGRFNVSNALLAVVMLVEAGHDVRTAAAGVASCDGVPGRMERVDAGQDFLAVVDYAHTPGAVERLLHDLREYVSAPARLIAVLGCGGDRDATKRPLMGAAAARGSDVLVVTDDNPRSEDAAAIRAAMLAGVDTVPAGERAEVIVEADRATAISRAVSAARPGDVVVVAGKGHEQGQEAGGQVHPFDDRDVLRAVLEEVRAS